MRTFVSAGCRQLVRFRHTHGLPYMAARMAMIAAQSSLHLRLLRRGKTLLLCATVCCLFLQELHFSCAVVCFTWNRSKFFPA